MSEHILLASSGNLAVDEQLEHLVGIFRSTFPQKYVAFYCIGSFADETAVENSDIDLYMLFSEDWNESDADLASALADGVSKRSPIRLDLTVRSIPQIASEHSLLRAALVRSSLLFHGDDVRAFIPLPSTNEFARDVSEVWRISVEWMRGAEQIRLPLSYPDAGDEFFGYTQKRVAHWYPAEIETGTKELVALATRFACAILAIEHETVSGSKRESVRLYKEIVGDEWAEYIEAVYAACNLRWHYRVPEESSERAELQQLCEQTVAFENDYLRRYQTFLLRLRESPDPVDQTFAEERLALFD